MKLDKNVKRLDVHDVALTKLSVAAAVLFIITIWPAAMSWVHSVNPWWFFAAAIVFGARPFIKFWK